MIFDAAARKNLKRKIILFALPRVVWAILWLLYFSCKNRFFIHEDIKKTNAILAFWHGEFLMLPFLYRKMRDKPKIFVISSEHFDGELMVKLYGYFGFKTIRGSSSKGGRRVLIQAFEKLREGFDTAITPDGPKGPRHSVADGVVAMAQKTGAPIIPVKTAPSRFWEMKSWDRFQIPKPFCVISYFSMPCFYIDKNIPLDAAKALVSEKMNADVKEIFGDFAKS